MEIETFVREWAQEKGHRPWIVDYVEDRGTWRLPHSEDVNAALDSHPLVNEVFDKLADLRPETIRREGAAIRRYLALHN